MFGKQIVEVCTIVAYWVLFVPLLRVWLNLKLNDKTPFDYFFEHSDYALYLIMGYLVLYRIVSYTFIKLTSLELGLWHRLTKTKVECEMQLEEAKSNYKNLDLVDGPPATISYASRLPRKRPPPPPTPTHTPPASPMKSVRPPSPQNEIFND